MKAFNITAYTDDSSQIEALKAFMKALKIKFELTNEVQKSPYDPEFVKKIQQGDKDLKNAKGVNISIEDLENLCK